MIKNIVQTILDWADRADQAGLRTTQTCQYCKGTKKIQGFTAVYDCDQCPAQPVIDWVHPCPYNAVNHARPLHPAEQKATELLAANGRRQGPIPSFVCNGWIYFYQLWWDGLEWYAPPLRHDG